MRSVCPHVPKDAIKQDLIKTKSAEQTINRIFDGAIVRNNMVHIYFIRERSSRRIRRNFELPASVTNFRCAALMSARAGSLRVHLSTPDREVQVRALAESTTRWCNR